MTRAAPVAAVTFERNNNNNMYTRIYDYIYRVRK